MGHPTSGDSLRRSHYFQVMPIVLLALVLVGFGRTFFLRPLFPVPPISWYLYLHGAVQVSWFLLLIAQTQLIARGRAALHRRLGAVGAVLAVLVVGVSFVSVLRLPGHFKSGHLSIDAPFDLKAILAIFWHDLASLIVMTVFLATALALRRRTAVHKRLMLFASNLIVAPAVPRIALLLASGLKLFASPPAQVLLTVAVVIVVLPLTLVAHDLATIRRVHPATLAGITGSLFTGIAGAALGASAAGQAIFIALE
ncbi:MAG: hypothetical protein ACREUT_09730 [Steroidobacteraceae bacterium]